MKKYLSYLTWIDENAVNMTQLLEKWANIHSGTHDPEGLNALLQELKEQFSSLKGKITEHPLTNGSALSIQKRQDAPIQILLCGHMDTVYSNHKNVTCTREGNRLFGQGVADMKGGLVVLLTSLQAFEKTPLAKDIGWTVLVTPDEEIGSPYSLPLLNSFAKKNHIGLLFEPCLHDGSIVTERMGSANYEVSFKGVSAHAGRDFNEGRSAVLALATYIKEIEKKHKSTPDTIINFGHVIGGDSFNTVPDTALCYINIRSHSIEQMRSMISLLEETKIHISSETKIIITLFQKSFRPPKLFDKKTAHIFENFKECGKQLGIDIKGKVTGGVCDGNSLAHAGLPNLDSLGVRGAHIHSAEEYMEIDSLVERAKLTCLFLLRLASGEITL